MKGASDRIENLPRFRQGGPSLHPCGRQLPLTCSPVAFDAAKEAEQKRALEALAGVNALLLKFSKDDDLHDDLKQPQVMMVRRLIAC